MINLTSQIPEAKTNFLINDAQLTEKPFGKDKN